MDEGMDEGVGEGCVRHDEGIKKHTSDVQVSKESSTYGGRTHDEHGRRHGESTDRIIRY